MLNRAYIEEIALARLPFSGEASHNEAYRLGGVTAPIRLSYLYKRRD
jgi:hypothetical protein